VPGVADLPHTREPCPCEHATQAGRAGNSVLLGSR
jgi:hypothetical protein